MKKTICFFISSKNPENTINLYKNIINELVKKKIIFKLINFYSFENKEKKNTRISFCKLNNQKFDHIRIFNSNDFESLCKQFTEIVAIDCIGKTLKNFSTRRLINKKNIKLIQILHTGSISNNLESYQKKMKFFVIKKNLVQKIFRILVFFKYFSNIHLYFDCRREIVKNIYYENKNKIRSFLHRYVNAKMYERASLINANSYDFFLQNKKNKSEKLIIFLDGNYRHKDILLREKMNISKVKKKYFFSLNRVFENLSKIYKAKVEICLHPSSNMNEYKKNFINYKITKFRTQEKIYKSSIVLFHESSSVIDAIISKKKIISLKTKVLGQYYSNRINEYIEKLDTATIDLDGEMSFRRNILEKQFKLNTKSLNKFIKYYINTNGDEPGFKKILRVIKAESFAKKNI